MLRGLPINHLQPTKHNFWLPSLFSLFLLITLLAGSQTTASAQTLNWEGQTGIFVTPLAYLAPSSEKGFGRPVVAYHFLNGGSVLGSFNQFSITMGAFQRVEFGYTRDVHVQGSAPLSNLWGNGFNSFNGKLNLIPENSWKRTWVPSLSIGFVARTQVPNVVGVIQNRTTSNANFYAVATKTITKVPHLPLVFNLGYQVGNSSLLGLAGNAPAYKGGLFGAAAFAIKGPARSTILLGSEFLQQPKQVEGVPGVVIPTTITYAARVVPGGSFPSLHHGWAEEKPRLSLDFGVAQIAGNVAPGVNLQARAQFAFGISYGF
jgi:hypothetical protein